MSGVVGLPSSVVDLFAEHGRARKIPRIDMSAPREEDLDISKYIDESQPYVRWVEQYLDTYNLTLMKLGLWLRYRSTDWEWTLRWIRDDKDSAPVMVDVDDTAIVCKMLSILTGRPLNEEDTHPTDFCSFSVAQYEVHRTGNNTMNVDVAEFTPKWNVDDDRPTYGYYTTVSAKVMSHIFLIILFSFSSLSFDSTGKCCH